MASAAAPPGRLARIAVALLLALATAAAYAGTLRAGFVSFDDPEYVLENPHVASGLTAANAAWAFRSGHASNWHPLTWISHMLDVELFGLAPAGHHATSLVLHVACALLLLFALDRMTKAFWPSALVAGLFALHPLNVESVAWVAERKNVLSTAFLLLTLLAWAAWVERRRPGAYALALAAYALGLMSKSMLVTLPFAMLLLDFWPLGRMSASRLPRLVLEKAPFLALAAVSSAVTYSIQSAGGAVSSSALLPLDVRASNALVSCARYLAHAVWPSGLCCYYPHPLTVQPVLAGGALLLLVGISWLAIRERTRRPWILVGWLWYLGTLVPVIGLVQVGAQAMADRYAYVPLVGVLVGVVWSAREVLGARPRIAAAVSIPLLLALGVATSRLVATWRSSEALFSRAISVTRRNGLAHHNLADALLKKGDVDGAIRHFLEALAVFPRYYDANKNLGRVLASIGRHEEAAARFRLALQTLPRSVEARRDLAVALVRLGRVDEGIVEYRTLLELAPEDLDAMNNVAWILATHADPARRDGAEAVRLAERARELAPKFGAGENAILFDTLAAAYAEAGRFDDAVRECEKAIALAERAGDAGEAARFRGHLDLFRARQPFRVR